MTVDAAKGLIPAMLRLLPRRGPPPAVTGLLLYSYAVHPHGFRRHTHHALVRLRMIAASVAECFDLFAPALKRSSINM